MRSLSYLARLSSAAGLMVIGNAASAQTIDSRWQAWVGCWEAVDPNAADVSINAPSKPRICIVPAAGKSAVDITTLVGDSVALRQHIDANGEQRAAIKEGCKGWDRATWSANGQRVFLRSAYDCPGGLTRTSNGVMAMTGDGEWLDVLGVVAGTTVGVRAARYREVHPASLPLDIAAALSSSKAWSRDSRITAAAPVTTADVIEASRYIDPGVVQTWLAERGEGFSVDGQQLVQMEKAGVPTLVIDVMVALSYPEVFSLDRTRIGGAPADSLRDDVGRTVYVYGWDPFFSPGGYRRGGYYGGYGGYGWYDGPTSVVVVRQPSDKAHGHVDKDKGYQPGEGATPRRGSTSGTKDEARGSKGESGGSSSKGSSSSGGSSSKGTSSGSGRTAKPRPPQ